tara:strand:- start:116821 stop:117636 length:816 start_codon:yes stop_codon:yes gene_type:complete
MSAELGASEGNVLKIIDFPARLPLLLVAGLAQPAFAATTSPVVPEKLTAWSMFMGADWVVKSVMLILVFASVTTWGISIAKYLEFKKASRAMTIDQKKLDEALSLEEVGSLTCMSSSSIVDAAREEVSDCIDLANPRSADAMTDRLSIRLSAVEGEAIQSMRTGFSVLASIGATSPFIGLFGTVWGIMNSFIGISQAQTTNLAVVAPGIAEALLATALGLVAAIPAVLLYNAFSRRMAGFRRQLHSMSARVACMVSRSVERAQVNHLRVAV